MNFSDVSKLIFIPVRGRAKLFPAGSDLAAGVAGPLATLVSKELLTEASTSPLLLIIAFGATATQILAGYATALYRGRFRVSTFGEVRLLAACWLFGFISAVTVTWLLKFVTSSVSISNLITTLTVTLGLQLVSRVWWRSYWEHLRRPDPSGAKRTLIYGAGVGGEKLIRALRTDLKATFLAVGIIDDNPYKANRVVEGVPVIGNQSDLARVAVELKAQVILLAIPSASAQLVRDVRRIATGLGVEFLTVPSTSAMIESYSLLDLQPPSVDELLGRQQVDLDVALLREFLWGRRILVTGAGGSIGSELSEQLVSLTDQPDNVFLLDRSETALHSVQLRIFGEALLSSDTLVLADIRDAERVDEIFTRIKPEIVFHAAALKHLPLLERSPSEAIKTNVQGTANVLAAAAKHDVLSFVNISTDKAADPTSVLGVSKLIGERLTASAAGSASGVFVSVRFGNVLGSSGSVVPTFVDQLSRGLPLTVTSPEVTRFFMTPREAASLVLQAAAIGRDGEVLILDMGKPVPIVSLAQQLIDMLRPDSRIVFTGLRDGEKLHEDLFSRREVGTNEIHPRIFHTKSSVEFPDIPEELERLVPFELRSPGYFDDIAS